MTLKAQYYSILAVSHVSRTFFIGNNMPAVCWEVKLMEFGLTCIGILQKRIFPTVCSSPRPNNRWKS